MTDPDPLPLNCPRCGVPLVYVATQADGSHVYVCDVHGEHRLASDGRLRGGVGRYGRRPKLGLVEH